MQALKTAILIRLAGLPVHVINRELSNLFEKLLDEYGIEVDVDVHKVPWYQTIRKMVSKYVNTNSGFTNEDIEDGIQFVLMRLLGDGGKRIVSKYNGTIPFLKYINGVLRNLAIDYYRSVRKRQTETGFDSTIVRQLNQEISKIKRDSDLPIFTTQFFDYVKERDNTRGRVLVKMLQGLLLGYNGRELARKLELSPASVSRNLKKLREMLKQFDLTYEVA